MHYTHDNAYNRAVCMQFSFPEILNITGAPIGFVGSHEVAGNSKLTVHYLKTRHL